MIVGVRGFLFRAGLGVALLVIGLIFATPAAQAAKEIPSPWTWTDYGPSLRDVSCSSSGKCVAVGQRGMALRNTSLDDVSMAWARVASLTPPEELTGVTCTDKFCLAVSNTSEKLADFTSNIYRSTDHGATWSRGVELPEAGPDGTQSASALACDPVRACYAVGLGGGAWRSLDEGRTWEALNLPPMLGSYRRLACPAEGRCVVVGLGSSAIIKDNKVETVSVPQKEGELLGLACDTPTQCIATTGNAKYMLLSISEEKWGSPKPFPFSTTVSALACAKKDICVGLAGPRALWTQSLSSPTGGWQRRPLPATLKPLEAITCGHATCVAVGKAGAWFASSNTGYDWGRINEVGKFDAVQCSAQLSPTCVAGGEKVIGVSRSRGELWSWPIGPTTLFVESLNCTGPSECLILGKNETRWTNDLRNFPLRQSPTADPMGVEKQTCITELLCVGIIEGAMYTTRDGAVTTWVKSDYPGARPTSVGCIPGKTNPAVCVVTTVDFLWIGTMSQGADRWSWRAADPDPAQMLNAVGCTRSGRCTVVGTAGEVLTSDYATHALHTWEEHILPSDSAPIADRPELDSVACPADNVCLAGGKHGPNVIIASTTDFWTDFSYDQIPGVEGIEPTIKSFGCETVDRCVAVGETALIGVRKLSRGPGCGCSRRRCSKSRHHRHRRRCLRR